MTALRHAVQRGATDLAELLTAHGADRGVVTDEDCWMGTVSTDDPSGAAGRVPAGGWIPSC